MALPDFAALAKRFDGPGVLAIALMGSHARGDAGPFSDVDLLRLLAAESETPAGEGSHLIDDRLVTVSNATPPQVEAWFSEPNLAVIVVASLREGHALLEHEGAFTAVQARANAFAWDDEMQAKADAYASRELTGWIEEIHKGLEGLHRINRADADNQQEAVGRLLHARFGCTFGLSHVVQVQRGIAINSDNAFYADVAEAIGPESTWSRLRNMAFGIGSEGRLPTLREQVEAGLLLFVETVKLLESAIQPEHRPLIQRTVERIHEYW